jgi:hypothetical protein
MFGYQIQGRRYTNFNRYYFAQRTKKGAIIDDLIMGTIADYITDVLSRDLLVILIIPLGTNKHLRHLTQGLGTKSNDH